MRVNLAITDRCNRACPECCCNVPRIKEHWDISMAELQKAADTIPGIHALRLTGGCPSLHPLFVEIVPILRGMFDCKILEIETNGQHYNKTHEVMKEFDLIEISRYTDPDFIPNTAEIERFIKDPLLAGKVHVGGPAIHFPRSRRAPGTCERGNLSMVSLYKSRIYACAMGWGIDDPISVPLSPDWLEVLKMQPLPCSRCFMAGT